MAIAFGQFKVSTRTRVPRVCPSSPTRWDDCPPTLPSTCRRPRLPPTGAQPCGAFANAPPARPWQTPAADGPTLSRWRSTCTVSASLRGGTRFSSPPAHRLSGRIYPISGQLRHSPPLPIIPFKIKGVCGSRTKGTQQPTQSSVASPLPHPASRYGRDQFTTCLPPSDAAPQPSAPPCCLFMTPGARDGGHYERDYTAKQTWLRPQLSLLTVGVGPGMIGGRTPGGSEE